LISSLFNTGGALALYSGLTYRHQLAGLFILSGITEIGTFANTAIVDYRLSFAEL
jgi:hypothetical protein